MAGFYVAPESHSQRNIQIQPKNSLKFHGGNLNLCRLVFTHIVFNISWWSRLNVDKSYVYFATLYGFSRLQYDIRMIFLGYFLESIYFGLKGEYLTSFVCSFIAFLIININFM